MFKPTDLLRISHHFHTNRIYFGTIRGLFCSRLQDHLDQCRKHPAVSENFIGRRSSVFFHPDFRTDPKMTQTLTTISLRTFSSTTVKPALALISPGWKAKLWNAKEYLKTKFKFLRYKQSKLKASADVMYSCCTDPLNHLYFFEVLGLPDTFHSWYKITELHVWMCMARLGVEGHDGKFTRNELSRCFWKDIDTRSQKLGSAASAMRKQQLKELEARYKINLFAYDEGLVSDDKVLAAALWRNFFGMKCDDPLKVEFLVNYVRTQIHNLDIQDHHQILNLAVIRWIKIKDIKT